MSQLRFAIFPTPLGSLTVVASSAGIVATASGEPDAAIERLSGELGGTLTPDARGMPRAGRELDAYFAGRLRRFATPVDLSIIGDGFARRALETVRTIPYGEMWTYGDVAALAGSPRAGRAAGSALRRCPVEVFVPCHRVVPSGPGLGRYGGDDGRRAFLLRLEGAI
jgi:methylated-DNA-[protein]-cysteine S-methyltransferase